jgi:hypothetical protein
MVQGLMRCVIVGSVTFLPACASLGITTVSDFCQIMDKRLPIKLSRKDNEMTKEEVSTVNLIYACKCQGRKLPQCGELDK